MKTSIGASVFVDPTEIRHDITNGSPVLTFGLWPDVRRLDLHFRDTAGIDALIAELVALKQEMDPPVTACPSVAPFIGRPCTETGEHEFHRSGMVTWTDKDHAPVTAGVEPDPGDDPDYDEDCDDCPAPAAELAEPVSA